MKFRPYAMLVALVAVVGLPACSKDPTASNTGVPEAIVTTRSLTNQVVGAKFSITAYAIDANVQRMTGKLDASAAGSAVAVDSVIYVHELLETHIFLNPTAKSATGTIITVTGHGLSKDVKVIVS